LYPFIGSIASAHWKQPFHPLEAMLPPNGKKASAHWKETAILLQGSLRRNQTEYHRLQSPLLFDLQQKNSILNNFMRDTLREIKKMH